MSIEICPRCEGTGYERSTNIARCQDCEGRGYSSALIVRTEAIPAEWNTEWVAAEGWTRYTLEAWACTNGALPLSEIAKRAGITTDQVIDVLNALGVNRAAVEAHIAGVPNIVQLEHHMRAEFGKIIASTVKLVELRPVQP